MSLSRSHTSFTVPLRPRYLDKIRETKELVEQHGATLVLASYPGTSFDAQHRLTITQPWSRAVAAYHCGPGCVESGRIPQITRLYAKRVLRGWRPQRYRSVDFSARRGRSRGG